LNVISSFIPNDERIVTIEDAAELQLRQEHVVTLESRPPNLEGEGEITIRNLLRNAMHMRPDRIIVGECRSGEALDMIQAMTTGHDGSLSTGHANSPKDMLRRLETMVLMTGYELPLRAIREQLASAVDLIVHTARLKDGSRKIVNSEIKEQTRQCLNNLKAKLEAAGSSLDKIVWANWSLREPSEFDTFNEEWLRWFPGDGPVGQGTLMPPLQKRAGFRVSIGVI